MASSERLVASFKLHLAHADGRAHRQSEARLGRSSGSLAEKQANHRARLRREQERPTQVNWHTEESHTDCACRPHCNSDAQAHTRTRAPPPCSLLPPDTFCSPTMFATAHRQKCETRSRYLSVSEHVACGFASSSLINEFAGGTAHAARGAEAALPSSPLELELAIARVREASTMCSCMLVCGRFCQQTDACARSGDEFFESHALHHLLPRGEEVITLHSELRAVTWYDERVDERLHLFPAAIVQSGRCELQPG